MNRETSALMRPAQRRVNITVICEDDLTHARAQRICDELADDLQPDFPCEVRWWSITQLRDVIAHLEAAEAAANADLLIISVHTGGTMPRVFDDWVDDWVSHRKPGAAALVGLVGTAESDHSRVTPRHDLLRRAAARAGMDYLPEGIWERTPRHELGTTRFTQRHDELSPMLQKILASPHPTVREWGINE